MTEAYKGSWVAPRQRSPQGMYASMPGEKRVLVVPPMPAESSQSAERRENAQEIMRQQTQEVQEILLNFYIREEELRARRSGDVVMEEAYAQVLRMADELVEKAYEKLLHRAPERARQVAERSLWAGFPDRGGAPLLTTELSLSRKRITERLEQLRTLLQQGDEEYTNWLTTELAKFHVFAQSAYTAGRQIQERARELARKQAQNRVGERLAQTGRMELPPLLQKSRISQRFSLTEYTEIPEITVQIPSFPPPRPLAPDFSSRIIRIWYETEGLVPKEGGADRTGEFTRWLFRSEKE